VAKKKMTAFTTLRDGLLDGGTEYLDQPVFQDRKIISSRTPNDLSEFCALIIEALENG
jgi:putative intracellular protease/amidase